MSSKVCGLRISRLATRVESSNCADYVKLFRFDRRATVDEPSVTDEKATWS